MSQTSGMEFNPRYSPVGMPIYRVGSGQVILQPVCSQQTHLYKSPIQRRHIVSLRQKEKIPMRIIHQPSPLINTFNDSGLLLVSAPEKSGIEKNHQLYTG